METKQIISWLLDKAARAQDHSYARMLNMAAKRLKELETWIPVTNQLPSIHEDVLMYFKDDDNMVAGYLDDVDEDRTMWCAYSDGGYWTDCDYEPTHWMPLPNPPKEVDHES